MAALDPAAINFVDEVGNPLPPGIQVSVYPITNGVQGPLLGQAYTLFGGVANITLTSIPNQEFIVYFVGNQAPSGTVQFGGSGAQPGAFDSGYYYDTNVHYDGLGGNASVTVLGYRSPFATQANYATEGAALQPTGWYDPSELVEGGVLHSVMRGNLAGIAANDSNLQAILEILRLQSCVGPEIDSWAFDYLGPLFQRFTNESDADFYGRVLTMIGRPRCTINAIQALCVAFFKYIEDQPSPPATGQLAFDVAGGYNATGAFDTAPPPAAPLLPGTAIFVWDGATQPGLAAVFNVQPGYFVIQIGALVVTQSQLLAFNTAGGFDTSGAFDVAPTAQELPTPTPLPPDARLATILAIIGKAAGTQILWIYGPSLQE